MFLNTRGQLVECENEVDRLKEEIEQLQEVLTLGGKLSPYHLQTWADIIDAENGYKGGNLSVWLRGVADALLEGK